MITAARGQYPALSLSVSSENPARRLYQRFGFTVVEQSATSLTMRLELLSQELCGVFNAEDRMGQV
jgi:ribosomal protein S18 acetylase RimI-like enzyme